ncbi:hypothetical protein A3731_40885 [Roseovarius sp. HI0049]|nr:hypothetical protein A3731_43305 [Roseovarius sp. HI0049]KZY38119.1 hypothetical protein A3731_40885 [Roseovarius sp. HI0049]
MAETPKVTINNVEYELDSLSDDAKAQLTNIQLTDRKIADLQQEISMLQTARNAYAKVLNDNMPKTEQ